MVCCSNAWKKKVCDQRHVSPKGKGGRKDLSGLESPCKCRPKKDASKRDKGKGGFCASDVFLGGGESGTTHLEGQKEKNQAWRPLSKKHGKRKRKMVDEQQWQR